MLVAFGATAVTGATLAYFTDDDVAANEFTVGNVEIDLTEPGWDGPNGTGKVEAETMYPGEAVAKDPIVTNTGENPAFIRLKVEWPDGVTLHTRTNYQPDTIHTEAWTRHTDGYYYYTPKDAVTGNVLYPDATTIAPLFDQIMLDVNTKNGDATVKNVVVKAEAVQAQGARPSITAVHSMTVSEIATWFTTCGMDNSAETPKTPDVAE